MSGVAPLHKKRAHIEFATPPAEPGVNELVRRLVNTVGKSDNESSQTQEIILDTNVDGARYLLVRLPRSNHASPPLSPREQEIVRMVSRGFPNKVIAGVLNISSWTVSTHLRRIFGKLGVTSRAAMVAQLLEVQTTREQSSGDSVARELPAEGNVT
jgi:two-component system nitrate/nitrite response regulator NarL